MIVKQIYTNNNYRNFNYLIACPITREAAAIDPLASELCLKEAENSDFKITSIINTHEHYDHIAGNSFIIKQTGAKLYAPNNAKNTIKNIDVGLDAGDIIKIGKNLNIEILDTPGHTLSHICLLVRGENDSRIAREPGEARVDALMRHEFAALASLVCGVSATFASL